MELPNPGTQVHRIYLWFDNKTKLVPEPIRQVNTDQYHSIILQNLDYAHGDENRPLHEREEGKTKEQPDRQIDTYIHRQT